MEENLKQSPANGIIRIALYGPESTGKTTLARQLADHFNTSWAPEFARDYLQKKWDDTKEICSADDMLPIAYGQVNLENQALADSRRFLFADTNLMVTKVFSEQYYGFCDPSLEKAARKQRYDLFFLTDIDVPWQKDDLRDKPDSRTEMLSAFAKALDEHQKPYLLLSGDAETRFKKAIVILEELETALKAFHIVRFHTTLQQENSVCQNPGSVELV